MTRKLTLIFGLACTMVFSGILSGALPNNAMAGNVWLSLNLELDDPADLNSGGTWTAVAKADEHGIAGLAFIAAPINFTGDFLVAGGVFDVFVYQTAGTGFEIVNGSSLIPPVLGVGVIGSSFPSSYVDPSVLSIVAGNPDLGSFTGGVEIATGTFDPGTTPELLETFATFNSGANIFAANGSAVSADLLTTVRFLGIPEPSTMLLLGFGLLGLVTTARNRV